MKKRKIILIIIYLLFTCSCSHYEELNNLSIISNITISYKNNSYIVTMQEIIPKNVSDKTSYTYKYRKARNKNIDKAFSNIIDHSPKKIYLRRVQNVIIDNKHSNKIIKNFLMYDKNTRIINKDAKVVLSNNNLDKIIRVNSDYKYIESVLKNKKMTLFKLRLLYKKKRKLKIPLISLNDKELIFKKYIYLHV